MFIKKHQNKNHYLVQDSLYIRNFAIEGIRPRDVNNFCSQEDHELYLENEYQNISKRIPQIDNEDYHHDKIVIVSDGYDFDQRQMLLASLPEDVKIIAVNGALKKWKMVGEKAEIKKSIHYYVVNNPYVECESYLPEKHRYYPRCIASTRTNPNFLNKYQGLKFLYNPVQSEQYSGPLKSSYYIDDYRNSVCAAMALAYRFGAKKILLFCCDDAYDHQRPSAIQIENGLWHYPQQKITHSLIDGNAYWLKNQKIDVADCSSGGNYKNAAYIKPEITKLKEYFLDV